MSNIEARSAESARAHKSSLRIGTRDLVAALTMKLGTRLLSFIAEKDQSTISRWKSGKTQPSDENLRPLRTAYQVFALLESAESDHTIRAWFIGINPQLDDMSPSEALRDGMFREVLAAARAFRSGG